MAPPSFSVVVPLYNKRPFVARAIRSVLSQSHQAAEIIVVDDGSTDRSDEVVLSIMDPRVQLVKKKWGGPGSARNAGIRRSKNSYIAFLDADDEWHPSYLQSVATAIETFAGDEIGIFTAIPDRRRPDYKLPLGLDREPYTVIQSFCAPSSYGYVVNSSTAVVPRVVLDTVGLFSERQNMLEDVDLWIRISLRHRILRINKVLTVIHYDDRKGITRRRTFRPYPLQIDSICRHFDCSIKDIPVEQERQYCINTLYRYCLGMLRWGRLEEFDRNFGRCEFTPKQKTMLLLARKLHWLIPKRS
jgi:glycosyltransferase involved in cell wall biosynthesis